MKLKKDFILLKLINRNNYQYAAIQIFYPLPEKNAHLMETYIPLVLYPC